LTLRRVHLRFAGPLEADTPAMAPARVVTSGNAVIGWISEREIVDAFFRSDQNILRNAYSISR
jgi:hypothetical protein